MEPRPSGGIIPSFDPPVSVLTSSLPLEMIPFLTMSLLVNSVYVGPRQVHVTVNGQEVLSEKVAILRGWWEDTSFQLERLQANPECVAQEEAGLAKRTEPTYTLTFNPQEELPLLQEMGTPKAVAERRVGG